MKKKILVTMLACISVGAFAQLKVESNGHTYSGNQNIDGTMGVSGFTTGVLNIKSSRIDPNYNSFYSFPLSLICLQSHNKAYPIMNMYNNGVNFSVSYDGQVNTKGVVTTSDSLCKEDIVVLEPVMSKIRLLHGVSFHYKENAPQGRSALSAQEQLDIPLGATPEISTQIAAEKDRKRIGLIAQEVERIYPEVVRTAYDGTKGILYNDLIGVLIEGMKELQDSLSIQAASFNERIAALESQLAQLTFPASPQLAPQQQGASSVGNTATQTDAQLFQNTPNPFNRATEIAYRLPQILTTASICIYNLNGQQLKKYPLSTESANGTVTVSASEFTPGMYLYALVIDNRLVDSKRMTLTD